jgi:hypothetical protein
LANKLKKGRISALGCCNVVGIGGGFVAARGSIDARIRKKEYM